MSTFKNLVDAVMRHGDSVIGETDQSLWTALNWMDRSQLEEILAGVGIQSHPSESDDELKQAIIANVEDGTIDPYMVLGEDAPKGWEGTVKAMKDEKDIDNPYALSWWMKKKGYKSHKKESIRVWHPTHGRGTVNEISESYIDITWDNLSKRITSPNILPFSDAKYLSRLNENYSNKPSDVDYDADKDTHKKQHLKKRKKKMKESKRQLDEGMVAIGMAGIGGTQRSSAFDDLDLDHLTLADLMLEEESEDKDDRDSNPDWDRGDRSHDSSDKSELRKSSDKSSDYVNVPRPADSVLTNQEDQPKYKPEPLATHAGYEEAHDEMEPDGDYGEDLLPVDAPAVPKVRDMEDAGTRKNTRKSGEGEDTHEAGKENIDFEGGKPEDDEDNQMKKYESKDFDLTADDLGITEMEHGDSMSGYAEECGDGGYGDMQETHDTGAGEVAFTKEFLSKLLSAVAKQAPDDAKLDALCSGLVSASEQSGATLDVSDWDSVKSAAASAYSGGGDMGADDEMDAVDAAPDAEMEPGADSQEDDAYFEEPMDDEYDYEEDRAEGDGEEAGPEGGKEHEGKTKMMDRKGDRADRDYDGDGEVESSKDEYFGSRMRAAQRDKQRKSQRKDKQRRRYGESSGTPIGTGSTAGPGGGSTKDLSKVKNYKGTAVGTQTGSGPGGGSTSNDGQKPTKDGGSNLVPANDKGSKLGAADTPFSKGEPNPRNQKALAAESKKRKSNGKKKLDEAIMLGMSSIPHMGPGRDPEIPEDAFDDDDELKMIKRRAGMENWWK